MDDGILLSVEIAHQELPLFIYIYMCVCIYPFHPKCHLRPSGSQPSFCTIIVIIVLLSLQQTKCIFNFHYRLIIVVVDCNKVATVVVFCTCPITQVTLKMNRPTYNFTGVIFYWGLLDLWATT